MAKIRTALAVACVLGLSSLCQAQGTAGLSSQGQLFMQLQQMQQEIAALRGMLEEQQNQIQRLQQEGLERYQELDGRLSQPQFGAAEQAGSASPVNAPTQQPSSRPPQPSQQPGNPEKEQAFYDAAYSLIQARDFTTAEQAFNAFLARYPDGKYSANAHYWLGEVNLVNDDLQGAGQAFATVIQNWPEHSKVPDSTYKLAEVERRLGRYERAKAMFERVIEQYPNSSAARLAQQELHKL